MAGSTPIGSLPLTRSCFSNYHNAAFPLNKSAALRFHHYFTLARKAPLVSHGLELSQEPPSLLATATVLSAGANVHSSGSLRRVLRDVSDKCLSQSGLSMK